MALITRFTRLFTADMHAVLDRIEEPEILLKQAVREMEAALAEAERRLRALVLRRDQVNEARRQAARALERLTEELDVCFAANNDDLARALIRRRLTDERHLAQLTAQSSALAGTLGEVQANVASQRAELMEMRQKAALFLVPSEAATPATDCVGFDARVTDDDVEVAFLREKQRREKQGRAGA